MVESGPAVSAAADFLVLLMPIHMRREEAAIVMLLQARQQSLQSRLYVADDAECNGMTMTDMRGVEIDLNDGGLVGIELGPRKICTEKKQRVAVEDRMIGGCRGRRNRRRPRVRQ